VKSSIYNTIVRNSFYCMHISIFICLSICLSIGVSKQSLTGEESYTIYKTIVRN